MKHKLISIFKNKCPKCNQGSFFISNNAFNLKIFDQMHPQCSYCKETFEKEPGFYYGAMYISYALNIIYFVALFIAMVLVFNFNTIQFLCSYLTMVILLLPITIRLSRLIYINFFVHYKKN